MRPAADDGDAAAVALRLGLEELVAAVVAAGADVIPAEHAARERAAAQAATAVPAFRFMFTAPNLEPRAARRIAFVSQGCNIGPNPGTPPRPSARSWRLVLAPAGRARAVGATVNPPRSANLF
jgi:hypothetical protein